MICVSVLMMTSTRKMSFYQFLSVHLKSICAGKAIFLLIEDRLAWLSSSKMFVGSEGGEEVKKTLKET